MLLGPFDEQDKLENDADRLMSTGEYDEVSYARYNEDIGYEILIPMWFDEIEKSDIIFVMTKGVDSKVFTEIGEAAYLLEYAKRLGKEVFIEFCIEFKCYKSENKDVDDKAAELLKQYKKYIGESQYDKRYKRKEND